MTKVREVMELDVPSVREDAALSVALELMRWRGVRHLPVVRGDHVVGVLSDRDVARMVGSGAGPELTGSVGDVMSRGVVTISPDADVKQAARELVEDPIGCLAVVDHDHLMGIVTPIDLMRALAQPPIDRAGEPWRP